MICAKFFAVKTCSSSTRRASLTFSDATNIFSKPDSRAFIVIGKIPGIPFSVPSRDNSAANKVFSSDSTGIKPCAANNPTAIERSSPAPSFRKSAGARLTVIFCCFKKMPVFFIAVLTRSLASLTAPVGKPTISNAGIPFDASTSTSMIMPSTPKVAAP